MQVFGYGSLVNNTTHDHDVVAVQVTGWRRVWRTLGARNVATLSVTPAPGATLSGVMMQVPRAAQAALDAREAGYVRVPVQTIDGQDACLYEVQDHLGQAEVRPILRSYLDVVLLGYEAMFGPESLDAFYQTTDGWHWPIYDDRDAPRYPRACQISRLDAARFDALHAKWTPSDGGGTTT